MVEGHVTDSAGITKVRTYLKSPHQPSYCPEHGDSVRIVDDCGGSKIVMTGCCKALILNELDQISRVIDWLDFYHSVNAAE